MDLLKIVHQLVAKDPEMVIEVPLTSSVDLITQRRILWEPQSADELGVVPKISLQDCCVVEQQYFGGVHGAEESGNFQEGAEDRENRGARFGQFLWCRWWRLGKEHAGVVCTGETGAKSPTQGWWAFSGSEGSQSFSGLDGVPINTLFAALENKISGLKKNLVKKCFVLFSNCR